MSDDIRPGDVVVCVDAGPTRSGAIPVLTRGKTYRVSAVNVGPRQGKLFIKLANHTPRRDNGFGYYATRFRKLPKADESFTTRIRACRPIKTKEPV